MNTSGLKQNLSRGNNESKITLIRIQTFTFLFMIGHHEIPFITVNVTAFYQFLRLFPFLQT